MFSGGIKRNIGLNGLTYHCSRTIAQNNNVGDICFARFGTICTTLNPLMPGGNKKVTHT